MTTECLDLLDAGQPGVQQTCSILNGQLQRHCRCPLPGVLSLGLEVTASCSDPGRWAVLEHQVLPGGPADRMSFPGVSLGFVL